MRRDTALELVGHVAARVVDACRHVVLYGVISRALALRLLVCLEVAVALGLAGSLGAEDAVVNHLADVVLGARGFALTSAGARVVLEQARVGDGVGGGFDADTALGFLHHGCEDETGVELGAVGGGLDCSLEVIVVVVAVGRDAEARAAFLDEGQIG